MNFFTSKIRSKSKAEKRVYRVLKESGYRFYREVGFPRFKGHKDYYRFDFFIPALNLLIEYDGWYHRTDSGVMYNDKIKTKWCKAHRIKLLRLNNKHWRYLEVFLKRRLKYYEKISGRKRIYKKITKRSV